MLVEVYALAIVEQCSAFYFREQQRTRHTSSVKPLFDAQNGTHRPLLNHRGACTFYTRRCNFYRPGPVLAAESYRRIVDRLTAIGSTHGHSAVHRNRQFGSDP